MPGDYESTGLPPDKALSGSAMMDPVKPLFAGRSPVVVDMKHQKAKLKKIEHEQGPDGAETRQGWSDATDPASETSDSDIVRWDWDEREDQDT